MNIPENLLENTQAALALASAALALGGLVAGCGAYLFAFLFIQNIDGAISPEIDSANAALADAQAVALSAAASSESASAAVVSISGALSSYSSASRNISDSISDISKVPPFSLDSRFASSAAGLREASDYFADAAIAMNATANTTLGASAGVRKTAEDLESAKTAMQEAKKGFKDALGALHIAALAVFVAACALFSSVIMLSVSVLLSHYPRFFEKSQHEAQEKQAEKKR